MATKNASRKRKQRDTEKLKQYGVDLPVIPGLPVQIIPLHIHALKKTTKFFQHDAPQRAVPPYPEQNTQPEQDNRPNKASSQSDSVMESIMHRLDESNTASSGSPSIQERHRRWEESNEAIQSWLQAIHRHVRDQKQQQQRETHNKSIPLAAMQHLWEITRQHKRSSVRRAALFMVGHLLEKSADTRRWLLEEGDVIVEWMDGLVDSKTVVQKEAYWLLQHLHSLGYGDLYPTLLVALQRFQQLYPSILHQDTQDTSPSTNRSMADWRRLRDLALDYCDEEERRVQALIRKCHACMDILVPRIGMEAPSQMTGMGNAPDDNGDDDDEQDDIDWEDGWEEDELEADDEPTESHAEAVERTLAVMQTTGTLRDGEIQINMQQQTEDELQNDSSTNPEMLLARVRLQKCVQVLQDRHMHRLSQWVEGITKADGLMLTKEGNALIRMPTATASRLKQVLDRLLQLKSSVASILSSAKQLGLEATEAENNSSSAPAPRNGPPVATNLMSTTRNQNLVTNLNRRRPGSTGRDVTRGRSNRIQIKYRKTH